MSEKLKIVYKNKEYISLARLIKELVINVDKTREEKGDVVFGLAKFKHTGPRNYYIINDNIYSSTSTLRKDCSCTVPEFYNLKKKARHYVFKHSNICYLGYFNKPKLEKIEK